MQLHTYQQAASATAVYPRHLRVLYPTLGLAGEVGELIEALEDRDADGTVDPAVLIGEFGDVCWYIAALSADLGVPLGGSGIHPTPDAVAAPLSSPSALAVTVGVIAEQVKKTVRDHQGNMPAARLRTVEGQLSRLLGQLTAAAAGCGLRLEDVLDANVAKLTSRKQRGQLHGDGNLR